MDKLENVVVERVGLKPGYCGKSLNECDIFKKLNYDVTDEKYVKIPCHNLCTFPPPTDVPDEMIKYYRGPLDAVLTVIIFGNTPR